MNLSIKKQHKTSRLQYLLGALTIAIGSNYLLPTIEAQAAPVSKSAYKKHPTEKEATPPSPEAGVKLLIGILERIGNAPLIAMKQQSVNQARQEIAQTAQNTNQIFQNTTNPALAIRPTVKKTVAGSRSSFDFNATNIAMNKGAKEQSPAFRNLAESVGKLKGITDTLDRVQHAATEESTRASDSMAGEPSSSSSAVVNIGHSTSPKGSLLSDSGRIMEFKSNDLRAPAWDKNQRETSGYGAGAAGLSPPPPPSAWRKNKADADDEAEMSRSASNPTKLDQPAYLRHIREAQKTGLPSMPPGEKSLIAMNRKDAISGKRLAYIPPSLVAGIPGLQLGSSEATAKAFLGASSSIDKVKLDGWQVWSLKHPTGGNTLLQIYLRNGTVEALRVFDRKYVPNRLGISLHNNLTDMKKQFGEPAFILNEPQGAGGIRVSGVKNYVYPVSQVSFQLARGGKDSAVRVKSMLLFKFI